MRIPDGTYSSGKFFFSSINSTTYLDNLQVSSLDTIPRTSAASISLPFSTGFGEIAVRDGVLQHPNIDLLGGGIRYPEAAQREGTRGTVLSLGASTSTAELAGPGTLSDFRMEFDFRAVAGRSHSVYFRAQDLDNGYRLDYDDGSVALSRVVKGVGVAIGRSTIVNISVDDAWVRFVIEALSDDLRVLEDKTLLVGTTDGTYTPGKVFLSSADSTTYFDNLRLTTLRRAPAVAPESLPAGAVKLDRSSVTTPGATVTVTLEDPQLNVGARHIDEAFDASGAAYTVPAGRGFPGATFTYGVQHAPLVDHNDDGFCCDALDVEVTGTTSITVLDLDRSMGRVKFQNDPGSPAPAGTPFTLSYSTAVLQTHPVSVYSTLDPKGFALVLRETGADTGKFKGTFATDGVTGTTLGSTVTTTSDRTVVTGFLNERDFGIDLNGDGDTSDKQPVSQFSTLDETVARLDSDGDGVTTSDDAGVDLNGDGAVTSTPVFGIDVAAVPESPVRPTIRSAGGAIVTVAYEVGGARQGAFVTIDTATPTISVLRPREGEALRTRDAILLVEVIDSVSGVDEETIKFVIDSPAGATTEGLVSAAIRGGFQVQAKLTGLPAQPEVDIVWHVEAGDRAGNNGASDADPETGGAQSHSFKIDLVPPVFAPPITHPVVTGHFWDSIEGKVVTDPAAASSTSIRVAFFEDIDGATVQRSDFTVDGTLPAAARSFAGAPNMVFLTVPHLASDARPRVVLVGEIKDAAGNARTGGLEAIAADRISPGLTLSASPQLGTGSVTIQAVSDERLLEQPVISVNGSTGSLGTPRLVSSDPWVYTSVFTPSDPARARPTAYNVEVTATDIVGNSGTGGESTPDTSGAVLFEIDTSLPQPTIAPGDNSSVYTRNPVISIDWTEEGKEYGLVAPNTATMARTAADIEVDLDTHDEVVLAVLRLDGLDLAESAVKEAPASWKLSLKDLALGEHELVINGTDEAGNRLAEDKRIKFTVQPFELPLSAGWNLVSLPGEPENGDINDLIPPGYPIDAVLTYDPRVPRLWLGASRGADGMLAGSLNEISQSSAYWIHTQSDAPLTVMMRGGDSAPRPTIELAAGWNMVPVLDVDGYRRAGERIWAGYLGSISVSQVFRYVNSGDRFDALVGDSDIRVGEGYWVFLDRAGALEP